MDSFENYSFSHREKAALRLAEMMSWTEPDGEVGPTLLNQLRESFSDAEIVELGVVMAVLTGMAKFLFAFNLAEKETVCPIFTDYDPCSESLK